MSIHCLNEEGYTQNGEETFASDFIRKHKIATAKFMDREDDLIENNGLTEDEAKKTVEYEKKQAGVYGRPVDGDVSNGWAYGIGRQRLEMRIDHNKGCYQATLTQL